MFLWPEHDDDITENRVGDNISLEDNSGEKISVEDRDVHNNDTMDKGEGAQKIPVNYDHNKVIDITPVIYGAENLTLGRDCGGASVAQPLGLGAQEKT